jgi:predicted nucleic acid-binding protein
MITAIDTNVLLDVLIPNERFCALSLRAMEEASACGALVICDLVYAELCIHFAAHRECDAFLDDNEIRVEPLDRVALFQASRIWREYRQSGGRRNRILTDFLIGAHAEAQATQLLSRDRGFYRRLFPSLRLLDPARQRM